MMAFPERIVNYLQEKWIHGDPLFGSDILKISNQKIIEELF